MILKVSLAYVTICIYNLNSEEINLCPVCGKIVIIHLSMKIIVVIYDSIIWIRIILALKILKLIFLNTIEFIHKKSSIQTKMSIIFY